MPMLTVEAIRENPWNVVTHRLPPEPTELLLEAGYLAATYCRNSEYMLMHAAREGRYVPAWWQPTADNPDVHEESEERGFTADQKLDEIFRRYQKDYGKIIGR